MRLVSSSCWNSGVPVNPMALYLFLVTVADAQGLSYYGGSTNGKLAILAKSEGLLNAKQIPGGAGIRRPYSLAGVPHDLFMGRS